MDTIEKGLKFSVVAAFSLLNAIDMVQTLTFLRLGIEANPFIVENPLLWAILKASFTFALPPILYFADIYLDKKTEGKEENLFSYLTKVIGAVYVVLFFADIFFLIVVIRNNYFLGRLSL